MFALGFKYVSGEKVQAIWSANGTALLKLAKALRSVNFVCWISGEGLKTNSSTTSDGIIYNDHPINVIEVGDSNAPLLFNRIYVAEKSGKTRWASESQTTVGKGSRYATTGWPRNFVITYGEDGSISVAPVAAPASVITDTPKAASVAAPAPIAPKAEPVAVPKAAPAAGETIGVVVDKIINGMKTTISMLREKLAAAESTATAAEKRAADAERRAAAAEKRAAEADQKVEMLRAELAQFSEDAEELPDTNNAEKLPDEPETTETAVQKMHREFREKYSIEDTDVMGRPITRIKAEAPASGWKPEIRMDIGDNGHLTVEYDSACDSKVFEERDAAMKQLLSKIFVSLPGDEDPNGWRSLCRYIEEGGLYNDCLDITINGIIGVENYCYDKSENARKALGLPTLAELHLFQDSNGYCVTSDNDSDPHDEDDFDFDF